MIAISDNTATNRVLDRLGFAAVNDVLARLGLRETLLRREMMDLQARAQGRENVTTATDIHNLLGENLHPKRLDPEVAAEALTFLERQQLPQGLGFFLPEGSFAHKTGELEGVFHDVGILWPHGPEPVIMTFLSKDVQSVPEAQIAAGRIGRLVYDSVMGSCR
jgi:beta-lactamase class A